MPVRSQRHKAEVHGYRSPAITGFTPTSATLAAAGAVARTIATLTPTGGTAPFTFSTISAGGISGAWTGNVLKTTADPAGTVGVHTMSVKIDDAAGKTFTGNLTVTLS